MKTPTTRILLTTITLCILTVAPHIRSAVQPPTSRSPQPIDPASYTEGLTWGQPTNGVCLGAKQVATQVHFYLKHDGQTNSGAGWLTPPGFLLVHFELHSDSGKLLSDNIFFGPPTNITYRALSDVPKNSRGVSMAHRPLPPNTPEIYAQIALTNYGGPGPKLQSVGFVSTYPGQYRPPVRADIDKDETYTLVARAQIMRIERKGNLTTIPIPPVSIKFYPKGVDRTQSR